MKLNLVQRSAVLVVALAMTTPVFAKPFTKTITISQTARFGKASLQAGDYQISIDGSKASVLKGKNTLAEIEGRWEDRNAKSEYNAVLLGPEGNVVEVRFEGQKRVFVVGQ